MNMNERQRESAAKFLYDLAKGVALITVVGPLVTEHGSWWMMLFGMLATCGLLFWAFWLEGDSHDTV